VRHLPSSKAVAFKKPTVQTTVPESPDRLFRDLPRRKHASLFDHQGQILRTYVAKALKASDVALQLPTGSGKTLVGLLLAEWRRRKFGERVVYLCPTRQLVNQVVEEASSKYGLTVEPFTGKVRNYAPEARAAYENADRVAVTTYSSLFNTNPFFSDPEIVIVDDAHASENYIASQWTLQIRRFDEDNEALFKVHAAHLRRPGRERAGADCRPDTGGAGAEQGAGCPPGEPDQTARRASQGRIGEPGGSGRLRRQRAANRAPDTPRAVRTPRLFNAAAMARKVVAPDALGLGTTVQSATCWRGRAEF
jgi:hypothetical protein